jgi:hypothetical protein
MTLIDGVCLIDIGDIVSHPGPSYNWLICIANDKQGIFSVVQMRSLVVRIIFETRYFAVERCGQPEQSGISAELMRELTFFCFPLFCEIEEKRFCQARDYKLFGLRI